MSDTPENDKPETVTGGFLSHLIEMRDRLLRVVIVLGVAFACFFPFSDPLYSWLAAPLVNQGLEMQSISPVAPVLVPMKLSLLAAFLITLPYLFYQLWSFVAPGLYKHEKRLVYPLISSSIFLFYLGIAFVYYVILPLFFKVIPQFLPAVATSNTDIGYYLDFTLMMFMAFGFSFELPIATILLISTGVTTAEQLKTKRPYVIVSAFILGMLLTPPDVISQVMLAIPMWILFELGLFLSRFFDTRIKEASEAKDKMDSEKTVAAGTATISADKLWEDDDYTYEDDTDEESADRTIHNEYTDDDSFNTSTPSSDTESDIEKTATQADSSSEKNKNNSPAKETENFFESNTPEDFDELSEAEMDAELDRIDAEEEKEEVDETAEKKTKKRAKTRNDKDSKNKG